MPIVMNEHPYHPFHTMANLALAKRGPPGDQMIATSLAAETLSSEWPLQEKCGIAW